VGRLEQENATFLSMHKRQRPLNELFIDALRTSIVWRSVKGTLDAGREMRKVLLPQAISGTGQLRTPL